MTRPIRTALVLLGAVGLAAALAGCFGPARGTDGRVTSTSEIAATTLLVGDCFSFLSDTDLSRVSVTPCAKDHTYVVIGAGELDEATVASEGGVQNAVSAACKNDFEAFKAASAPGTKPEQQFIVSTKQRDGGDVTAYLCVATDAA